MKLFGREFGTKADANPVSLQETGDVYQTTTGKDDGIFKSYIPNFLYKPPFGYPRKENIPLIRQLSRNPYIFSVVKTLADEVASTGWDIVLKEGKEMTPALEKMRDELRAFFNNPNANNESFSYLLRAAVKDILEVDAGLWIKVFNKKGEFKQLFARDGGTFLKNPDIYGYMGERAEFVAPLSVNYTEGHIDPASPDWQTNLEHYSMTYKDIAAYYQYGWTAASLPVPFGRREVVYMMNNPQTSSVYGISPVQILADVILTLIYGSYYNLDFYQNNNMPEGIISVIDGNQESITAFRERMDKVVKKVDEGTGFLRKVGFRIPITNKKAEFTPFQLTPQVMEILPQQEWFTKIVWMCFGVTADEMGFTENSNRATADSQIAVSKRKAVKPLLQLIKYNIDKSILPEWGEEVFDNLEFQWEKYDIEEETKKYELYEKQINMGVMTPEMIADEEGIDYERIKAHKDEQHERDVEKASAQANRFQQNIGQDKKENSNDKEEPTTLQEEMKAEAYENDLEEELVKQIKKRSKQLTDAIGREQNPELDKIR